MHGALGRATTVGQEEKQPVVRWAGPRLFLVFTVALLCFLAFRRPLALGGLLKRDLWPLAASTWDGAPLISKLWWWLSLGAIALAMFPWGLSLVMLPLPSGMGSTVLPS